MDPGDHGIGYGWWTMRRARPSARVRWSPTIVRGPNTSCFGGYSDSTPHLDDAASERDQHEEEFAVACHMMMRRARAVSARIVLPVVFGAVSLWFVIPPVLVGLPFGWDAVVYTHAAKALLAGTDPWLARGYAIGFAAPPPSLIPFLPFVWLPDWAISVSWVGISGVSAVYSVRKLGLPWWWLLFPPITLGVMAGSGALLCIALLIHGGVIADGLAVATRIYAVLPLAILGRWRSVGVSLGILISTALFLDWPAYIGARERVAALFQGGAANLSALAVPWLIPIAVGCLFLLGRRRAAWLVVPMLWPFTQPYYAVIALPVLAELPFTALALALPVPGIGVAGMVADLLSKRAGRSEDRRPLGKVRDRVPGSAPMPE